MARNSSIFNFSRLRDAAKLPWRAYAWHALLVAGAVAVVAVAATRVPYQPRREHAPKDLRGLAEAEVLVLGNSQLAALDEHSLIFPMKNFALGGTGIRSHNALLRAMAPQMPKLRVVLLGFDNIPLRVADIEQRNSDFRDLAALGLPWYQMPTRWRDRVRFAVRNSPAFRNVFYGERPRLENIDQWSIIAKAQAAVTSPARAKKPAESIFKPRPGYVVSPVQGQSKMTSYMRAMQDPAVYKKGRDAFFQILDYCAQHNLQVVLVRTPTTPAFSGSRSAAWNEEIVALLKEARVRLPKLPLPVWDAERSLDIPIEKFRDPNHLEQEGFAIFAKYLNAHLAQSPFTDESSSLFAFKQSNLLPTSDPREDAWRGMRKSDASIQRADELPVATGGPEPVFRVTLKPDETLYCPVEVSVSNDSFAAEIWLWATEDTSADFYFTLARDGGGVYTSADAHIETLSATPKRFELSHTFPGEYSGVRLFLKNGGKKDITFLMAGSVLRHLGPIPPAKTP